MSMEKSGIGGQQVRVNNKLAWSRIGLLLFVTASVNELFNLVPWARVHGVFNISDIGLLVLFGMFVFLVLARKIHLLFDNGFSILVLLYLFFVIIQAAMVSFNFEQRILSGLVQIRHQFYYLAFFVFLAVLDSREKIEQYVNIMFILGGLLILLGTINHFVVTIFHHGWAEGHMVRFGVLRAYIPAMNIVTMGLIWAVVTWVVKARASHWNTAAVLFFTYGQLLRQTRGIIVAAAAVIVLILIKKKNYKALASVVAAVVIAAAVAEVVMEENIILAPFTSTAENISEGTGSWSGRLQQWEVDWQIFLKHPYLGSGTSAMRVTSDVIAAGRYQEFSALGKSDDLGYGHWLKAYGVPGVLWLLALYALIFKYYQGVKRVHDPRLEPLMLLAMGYLAYVMISFVTIPHFMRRDLILLVCMVLAILVRLHQFNHEAALERKKMAPENI